MTNASSPYAETIADLKKKRAQIDNLIRGLEAMAGLAPSGPAPEEISGEVDESGHAPTPDDGAFLGMSIPDATKKLLQMRKRALSNAEITQALEAGGLVLTSANKVNAVGSIINRRFRQKGDIVSPKRGYWGLKEWYPGRNFGKRGADEEGTENPDVEVLGEFTS